MMQKEFALLHLLTFNRKWLKTETSERMNFEIIQKRKRIPVFLSCHVAVAKVYSIGNTDLFKNSIFFQKQQKS